MTASAPVSTQRLARTLVITLDRPDVLNAIDHSTAEAIGAGLDELDSDDELRVGIITGSTRTFSVGADLKALSAGGPGPFADGRGFAGLVERRPRKPLIAAVEGWALGGGLEIVLACDLVTASTTAQFALPEVTHGLTAGGGGTIRLPKRIPRTIALEILLTGRRFDAEEARGWGLVNRVTEPGEALAAALALAVRIAASPAPAVQAILHVARETEELPDKQAFAFQAPFFEPVQGSADTRRRIHAFTRRSRG